LRSLTVPVVFVTAFPERLATGRGPEPAFLVRKPFREEAIRGDREPGAVFRSAGERPGARLRFRSDVVMLLG
jgi:hypothetical protein